MSCHVFHRIDDVQDDAVLRRAVPVAHSIFGVPQTINSANYVYFLALQELLKLNQPHMITIYTEELINLHRGQGIELFWRDSRQCPTEEEYIEMVNNSKYAWCACCVCNADIAHIETSGLFRLAVRLMQEAAGSPV